MTYIHRVTFGQQYAREAHPRVTWAHPNGWLEIEVEGVDDEARAAAIARELAFDTLGIAWAFDYTPPQWRKEVMEAWGGHALTDWYPLGCLARVTIDGRGHTSWAVFHEFAQTMAEVKAADMVGDGNDGPVDIRRHP